MRPKRRRPEVVEARPAGLGLRLGCGGCCGCCCLACGSRRLRCISAALGTIWTMWTSKSRSAVRAERAARRRICAVGQVARDVDLVLAALLHLGQGLGEAGDDLRRRSSAAGRRGGRCRRTPCRRPSRPSYSTSTPSTGWIERAACPARRCGMRRPLAVVSPRSEPAPSQARPMPAAISGQQGRARA